MLLLLLLRIHPHVYFRWTLPNRSFLVATQYATHGRLVSRRCDCDTFFCTTFSRAVSSSSSSFARNTFLHRLKAITFSSKIFQTCCFYFFFCSCCSYFNALARYSTFFFAATPTNSRTARFVSLYGVACYCFTCFLIQTLNTISIPRLGRFRTHRRRRARSR